MDWNKFVPDEAKAKALRPKVLFMNGQHPFAPVEPIKGVAPPKCDKCGVTLPFIMTDYKSMACPGGCESDPDRIES